jgi:transposase
MLKEIDAERNAIASARMSAHTNAKKIQDLVKLKAIGPEIATVLTGEVLYRPFNNRRELASYVGLTPSHFQSGSTCRDQGISKAGNPKARTTMIELAWLWLRHQPDSAFSVWFRERVGNLKDRRAADRCSSESLEDEARHERKEYSDPRWMCDRSHDWLKDAVL